ncbi:hypothetical protein ACFL0U_03445 [Pseudomonadota bacterium]
MKTCKSKRCRLEGICKQPELFSEHGDDPYKVETTSVERAIKLYQSELDIADCFPNQFRVWKKELSKTDDNYKEILRLEKKQKEYVELAKNLVSLSKEIKKYRDKCVCEESDFEKALQWLDDKINSDSFMSDKEERIRFKNMMESKKKKKNCNKKPKKKN